MIFPWIWKSLPGPVWVRTATLVVATAAVVWVLFEYGFPWFSVQFGIQDQNVGQ